MNYRLEWLKQELRDQTLLNGVKLSEDRIRQMAEELLSNKYLWQMVEETIQEKVLKENKLLKRRLLQADKATTAGMEKWLDCSFESSTGLTQEFSQFAREYKKFIKKNLPEGAELINWSRGHFEVSGFIKSKDSKYVYFACSDVRYFRNEWHNSILIRTAESEKDYIGGSNCYNTLETFKKGVEYLLR